MHVRQCEIVCDVDKLSVDLQATLMNYKTIKQWAYIIHDKDDTRPHYHIYLNFGTSVLRPLTLLTKLSARLNHPATTFVSTDVPKFKYI